MAPSGRGQGARDRRVGRENHRARSRYRGTDGFREWSRRIIGQARGGGARGSRRRGQARRRAARVGGSRRDGARRAHLQDEEDAARRRDGRDNGSARVPRQTRRGPRVRNPPARRRRGARSRDARGGDGQG